MKTTGAGVQTDVKIILIYSMVPKHTVVLSVLRIHKVILRYWDIATTRHYPKPSIARRRLRIQSLTLQYSMTSYNTSCVLWPHNQVTSCICRTLLYFTLEANTRVKIKYSGLFLTRKGQLPNITKLTLFMVQEDSRMDMRFIIFFSVLKNVRLCQ